MEQRVTISSEAWSADELHRMLTPVLAAEPGIGLELRRFRSAEAAVLVALVGAMGTGLGALVTKLLEFARGTKAARIVFHGRTGTRIVAEVDCPPEKIAEYLAAMARIDVGRIEIALASVFCTYRRNDTRLLVGRVADRLKASGYDVTYDVESLLAGEEWRAKLRDFIVRSDAIVAFIGANWDAARLLDSEDVVRMELSLSFDLHKPVIPVLVDGARLPERSELPVGLRGLCDRQTAELSSGRDFDHHMSQLLDSLDRRLGENRCARLSTRG